MSEFKDSAMERSSNDNWKQGRAGFRYDFRDWEYNPVTLSGDVYSGKRSFTIQLPNTTAPSFVNETLFGEQYRGGNVLLNWKTPITDEIEGEFKSYVDYIYRDSDFLVQQERLTYNFEFQATYTTGAHSIIAGTELRHIKDNLDNTSFLSYNPESSEVNIFSIFAQDKISLSDTVSLTLGSKFDYNDYTHFEFQPNARILWQVTEDHSLWGAVSRAVRTPGRGGDSFQNFALQGYPLGTLFLQGNAAYESENLIAYELGYRGDVSEDMFLDVTMFYNDYSDLRTTVVSGGGGGATFLTSTNDGYGESYGLEIASVIGITDDFDVRLSSTYLKQTFHSKGTAATGALERDEERSPEWQHSVHANYRVNDEVSLNANAFYVDELTTYTTSAGTRTQGKIDAYVRLDLGVSWKPEENIEIKLVGQNLTDSYHQEFDEIVYTTPSEVPRTAYIQVKYKF
jgi:iron complex outermembrane receptor protein